MWRSPSERHRWGLLVALGALLLAAANLWWVGANRDGFPFDVDEAGYTTFAWLEYLGLKEQGLGGWWDAIFAQAPHAPLLPGLTSLVLYTNEGLLQGFAVLSGFLVLLALAAYGIGERLAGPRLGALAALVTVTMPGAFAFSREFIFALPAAALLACATCFLILSEGLRRRRWALALGVAVGLLLLSRTVAIAYTPGLLAAAGVAMLARADGDLRARAVNLGLALAAAVAVAGVWYAKSFDRVVDYLTGYGYGGQSQAFGSDASLLSWERLRARPLNMVEEDLLLPLALLLLAGLGALAVAAWRAVADDPDRRAALRRLAAADAAVPAIVFVVGLLALTSSRNNGNGFTLPLAVLLPPLAVLALRRFPAAAPAGVAAALALSAFAALSTSGIWAGAAAERTVRVPGLGELAVVDGVPRAVAELRPSAPGPETRFDAADRAWVEANREVARRLLAVPGPGGVPPVVAFATRSRAVSTNSVSLAATTESRVSIPFAQLRAEPEDSVANYVERLTAPEFGQPAVLVTASGSRGDYPPHVSQRYAVEAARRVRFRPAGTLRLPNGRVLTIWRRAA